MSLSVTTRKRLWGRAGGRCAFPACRIELFAEGAVTDDPTLIGEEAHIIAREDNGPRGDPSFPIEKRDLYGNLILLCCNHHKLVDTDVASYPVEALKAMKAEHEAWVRQALSLDDEKLQEDEQYAALVDEWSARADLARWNSWTSGLMGGGQPRMSETTHQRLSELKRWMFTRLYPRRYDQLEASWDCFRRVLEDLLFVFDSHSERVGSPGNQTIWIEKKYKNARSLKAEQELECEFNAISYLVEDLTTELTRAANMACDYVRRHVDMSFRREEGVLTVTAGPGSDLSYRTYRPEYPAGTMPRTAYPGLKQFKKDRLSRAPHFGTDEDNSYLGNVGEPPIPEDL